MDVRIMAMAMAMAMVALPVSGQQIRTATGPQTAANHYQVRRIPALGAEPLHCEQHKFVPHAYLYCRDIERMLLQGNARQFGTPQPSDTIATAPSMGSADAERLGMACISGTVMRRLSNGWEQMRDQQNRWLRCRET